MSRKQVPANAALPSTVTKAEIKPNKGGEPVILVNGFVQLYYYESILQDSIKADFMYADSGNTVKGKSAMEGVPIVGTEDFTIAFEDNNGNKLKFSDEDKNGFIVNKVTPTDAGSGKEVVVLNLVSEEYIRNDEGASHVNVRMDGKISDHITDIFENFLKTEKELDIEETDNNYNFVGNNKKPFYILNWLSKFGVPSGGENASAGYFFWETSEGYKFKSIDGLFKQEPKKRFIYNSTASSKSVIPEGYDGKILEYVTDNRINYQEKIAMGAYGTKLVVFNPFDCFYQVVPQTAEETEDKLETGGENLPVFNKKFKNPSAEENFTRTTFMLVDTGTLPSGDTKEQVDKNEDENFEAQKVLNQGIRRYNQFYASEHSITIGGDFSLHAGDAIYIDTPSIQAEKKDDDVNKETGGLYIISDLCHYISPKQTYTKLNVVRDSFGRKAENAPVSPPTQ